MAKNILVVAVLSLIAVACGKSDDGDDVRNKAVIEAPASAAESAAASEQADAGEAVYKRACVGCHMTGAAGAPKVGDANAWESRIAKGNAALVQSAIAGVPGTAMMARGTCGTCSDDEIRAAVEYMIAQSR
jgi:cytochrome c5